MNLKNILPSSVDTRVRMDQFQNSFQINHFFIKLNLSGNMEIFGRGIGHDVGIYISYTI